MKQLKKKQEMGEMQNSIPSNLNQDEMLLADMDRDLYCSEKWVKHLQKYRE